MYVYHSTEFIVAVSLPPRIEEYYKIFGETNVQDALDFMRTWKPSPSTARIELPKCTRAWRNKPFEERLADLNSFIACNILNSSLILANEKAHIFRNRFIWTFGQFLEDFKDWKAAFLRYWRELHQNRPRDEKASLLVQTRDADQYKWENGTIFNQTSHLPSQDVDASTNLGMFAIGFIYLQALT